MISELEDRSEEITHNTGQGIKEMRNMVEGLREGMMDWESLKNIQSESQERIERIKEKPNLKSQ